MLIFWLLLRFFCTNYWQLWGYPFFRAFLWMLRRSGKRKPGWISGVVPSRVSPWVLRPRVLRIQRIRWVLEAGVLWVDIVRILRPCVVWILRPFKFRVLRILRLLRRDINLVRLFWLSLWLCGNVILWGQFRVEFRLIWNLRYVSRLFGRNTFFWRFLGRRDKENYLRRNIDNYRGILLGRIVWPVVREAWVHAVGPNRRPEIRVILIIEEWVVFEGIPFRVEKRRIVQQTRHHILLRFRSRRLLSQRAHFACQEIIWILHGQKIGFYFFRGVRNRSRVVI